jgi:hypothetical protein
MGDRTLTPDIVRQQIRYALSRLRSRNGHHLFEEICREYARMRISVNVLPATGPVGAGGDQGRDFETLPFRFADGDRRIAFACTLRVDRLEDKIRSDIDAIVAGGPVDMIYMFCERDIAVAKRHTIIESARSRHGVEVEIVDGAGLAEHLAAPDTFWIAERYLQLPPSFRPSDGAAPKETIRSHRDPANTVNQFPAHGVQLGTNYGNIENIHVHPADEQHGRSYPDQSPLPWRLAVISSLSIAFVVGLVYAYWLHGPRSPAPTASASASTQTASPTSGASQTTRRKVCEDMEDVTLRDRSGGTVKHTLKRGAIVTVDLNRGRGDWWYVRADNDISGWALNRHLCPVG